MNPELSMWCGRLLSAAGTGVYQGLLLTAVIWVLLRLMPRTNAATRHAVAMAALVLVAVLPFMHLARPAAEEGSVPVAETSLAMPEVVSLKEGAPDSESVLLPEHAWRSAEFDFEAVEVPAEAAIGSSSENFTFSIQEFRSDPEPASAGMLSADEGISGSTITVLPEERTEHPMLFADWPELPKRFGLGIPAWATFLLVGVWALLAGIRVGHVAWQCRQLQLLKQNGSEAPEHLRKMLGRILGEMEIRREPRVTASTEISAPMAAGYFRPAILLPAEVIARASSSEIESLLRHEAAHLRRRDDWANLFQQITKAVFFFHPGVWWLSRRLTLEREIACDDHVLAASGSRQAYALLLTEFAGRIQSSDWEAAPAAWSRKSQLKERIGMILDQKRNSSTRLARSKVGLTVVAGTLMAAVGWQSAPRLVFAQETSAAAPTTLIAEESAISTEVETPERSKPSRTAITTITTAPAPLPGGSATAIISASATPAVEARPAARSSVTFAPAAPRLVEPEIALDIKAPVLAQAPPMAPTHPKPPAPRKPEGDSLERRVERLERMIESLVASHKENPLRFDHKMEFHMQRPDEGRSKEWEGHVEAAKEYPKQAESWPQFGPNEKEVARIREKAVQRAVEQAQRDAELAARMSREMVTKFQGRRGDLDARRRALEQEMQALERQMQRLEGMLEQLGVEEESIEVQEKRKFRREGEKEESQNLPGTPVLR